MSLVLVLLLLLLYLLGNVAYVKKQLSSIFALLLQKRNSERFMRGTWLTVYYITLTLFTAKFYKHFQ